MLDTATPWLAQATNPSPPTTAGPQPAAADTLAPAGTAADTRALLAGVFDTVIAAAQRASRREAELPAARGLQARAVHD